MENQEKIIIRMKQNVNIFINIKQAIQEVMTHYSLHTTLFVRKYLPKQIKMIRFAECL